MVGLHRERECTTIKRKKMRDMHKLFTRGLEEICCFVYESDHVVATIGVLLSNDWLTFLLSLAYFLAAFRINRTLWIEE